MRTTVKLALITMFGLFLLCALPATAAAQDDVLQKHISSLELSKSDVREAVKAVFKDLGVSYSVAPDVQGQVTASLKDVTVELALQNILRQVDATYRVEAGVYQIVKRTGTVTAPPAAIEEPARIHDSYMRRVKIRSADPQFIAMMLGAKKGTQNYYLAPEYSTIIKTTGGGSGGFGSGSGGSSGSGSGAGQGSGNSSGSRDGGPAFGSGGSYAG